MKNPITKNQKPKQCHLPAPPICKNFRDWFLGKYHRLMWLNLYGRQAVRRKLKKRVKTQKMHFYPFFQLFFGNYAYKVDENALEKTAF